MGLKEERVDIGKVIIGEGGFYVLFEVLVGVGIWGWVGGSCELFEGWVDVGFGVWMEDELGFGFD